ncbi:MAG: recombinational DNA repair protein (RecF pathway) [Myxococcota bacterium]|jgi:recombinational DNA repair protein (RecF pathway)
MSADETEAIVLRLVDHGETNRIATFYSPTLGRFAAIARGARSRSRRFGGHLDLFHRGNALLKMPKRGGMPVLTDFSATEMFSSLRGDLDRFSVASFFLELVLRSTVDRDPSTTQYEAISEALQTVADSPEPMRPDLIVGFQLRWFALLGELPPLEASELAAAHLPPLEDSTLSIARALAEGVSVTDLDEAHFRAVGVLTHALRNRINGRPLGSSRMLAEMLADHWLERRTNLQALPDG